MGFNNRNRIIVGLVFRIYFFFFFLCLTFFCNRSATKVAMSSTVSQVQEIVVDPNSPKTNFLIEDINRYNRMAIFFFFNCIDFIIYIKKNYCFFLSKKKKKIKMSTRSRSEFNLSKELFK